MGTGASSVLPSEAVQNLETNTNFTSKEINRILKRYAYYDPDKTHGISLKDFLDIPEVSTRPIMTKVATFFLDTETQRMTPSDFIKIFSILSSKSSLETKKEFAFKVMDTDGNGYLSYDEMFSFYRMLLGPTLTDDQILNIVMETVNNNSADNRGLSYDEFLTLVSDKEVDKLFTVELQ